jgi:hypothetical protein
MSDTLKEWFRTAFLRTNGSDKETELLCNLKKGGAMSARITYISSLPSGCQFDESCTHKTDGLCCRNSFYKSEKPCNGRIVFDQLSRREKREFQLIPPSQQEVRKEKAAA